MDLLLQTPPVSISPFISRLVASVRRETSRHQKQLSILPICLVLAGCMTAAQHQKQLGSTADSKLTLGVVQKEIKVGMDQAAVATALGSPNIVTGGTGNVEVWIYDKVASESTYSSDNGGLSSNVSGDIVLPGQNSFQPSGSAAGTLAGTYSKYAGASSSSQRTLTVVIKFTASKAVESVSYNSTRF